MGELLNTLENVHFFPPRRPGAGFPPSRDRPGWGGKIPPWGGGKIPLPEGGKSPSRRGGKPPSWAPDSGSWEGWKTPSPRGGRAVARSGARPRPGRRPWLSADWDSPREAPWLAPSVSLPTNGQVNPYGGAAAPDWMSVTLYSSDWMTMTLLMVSTG